MNRCPWCMCNDKMIRYHDEEWGVPLHDDQKQFEFLMMESDAVRSELEYDDTEAGDFQDLL